MGFVVVTPSMAAPLEGDKRWGYLARQKFIRLASVKEDGSIYLQSSWYVVRDEKIYVPVDGAASDGVAFEPGRPTTALVDGGDEFTTGTGVRIEGTTKAVDDAAVVDTLEQLVFEKYFYPGHPYADAYFRFGQVNGRKYYELKAKTMIGWDNRETTGATVFEKHLLPKSATDRRV